MLALHKPLVYYTYTLKHCQLETQVKKIINYVSMMKYFYLTTFV